MDAAGLAQIVSPFSRHGKHGMGTRSVARQQLDIFIGVTTHRQRYAPIDDVSESIMQFRSGLLDDYEFSRKDRL
jgi:hypothetical protein